MCPTPPNCMTRIFCGVEDVASTQSSAGSSLVSVGNASIATHLMEVAMHICPRCNERPTKKGYCSSCQTEYNRIWKSNHKKSPPKGELKGNWRRAEKDFELPPITMAYLTPKGGMLCGFCKTEMHFI